MNEERTGKCLRQVEHIRAHLWRKLKYSEKTTDLSQVTDKFVHTMLYRVHLACAGFEHTTLAVIT